MTAIKKERNINLDLLRIASMLLIVWLHSIDHSGVLEHAVNCGKGMHFYVRFAHALCQVCVNIYVMLSGYFMVTSRFRLHKLVTLWMEAAFYSFTLKLLFMLTGQETFSAFSLASCFLPILTGRYWFLTIYVGMYLISPFLNTLIRAMDRRQHTLLNMVLFAVMSVWASLHPAIAGMNTGGGWGLAWFVVLYLAAAWLRLYAKPYYKPRMLFAAYLLIPAAMALMLCLSDWGYLPGIAGTVAHYWYRYDSAPVYLMTMCLFVGFLNLRSPGPGMSSLITRIAPMTLGVYLIHDHPSVRLWFWAVLQFPAKMDLPWFPLVQFGSVIGIFAACAAMDAVRNATLGRLENCAPVRQLCTRLEKAFQSFFDSLMTRS